MTIKRGDWVSFERGGFVCIAEVIYVRSGGMMGQKIFTTRGTIYTDDVLEVREAMIPKEP